jgi:hypothetical protein
VALFNVTSPVYAFFGLIAVARGSSPDRGFYNDLGTLIYFFFFFT